MKIVIKVGGSVAFDDKGPKVKYINRLISVLKKIKKKNQLIVCVGGGRYVKNYEKRALELLPRNKTEESSIELLKANVMLFSHLLCLKPIFSLKKVNPDTNGVIAGIEPGRSTDANAAICAKIINADLFIKLTNTDGIYDKDPNRFSGAKFLPKVKFNELKSVMKKEGVSDYKMLDPLAIKTIAHNRIKTVIINGKNPDNVLKVIKGRKTGTLISD